MAVDAVPFVRIIYLLGTLVSAGMLGLLWQYRDRTGAPALLVMMGGLVIWHGSLFFGPFTHSVSRSILFLQLVFVGIAIVTPMKLVFTLEYTGREHLLRPAVLVPLAVPSVLLVLFAFANPADLLFASLEARPDEMPPVSVEFGIAFTLYAGYGYLLNLLITGMIVGFIYRSRSVYRGQSSALLGGSVAPWIATAFYLTGITEFDTSAVGAVGMGVLFTIAIVRYRLLDLMPIARDRVLDNVNDGVFVVDRADRLVDVNPAGRRMLASIGVDDEPFVGEHFPSLLPHEELRRQYEAEAKKIEETTVEASIGPNYFQVTATPIDDGRGRHVGWLLIVHDVTERKRREEQLELQNERLEQFASLVSHDLRNPLNVAGGYLDLAREADDTEEYFDEIEDSYERIETIIEDVLALTREGAEVTDPRPVGLGSIVERSWDGVDTGDASLEIRSNGRIIADPDRVQRLFENLFRNVVEHGSTNHTEPDGSDDAVEHDSTSNTESDGSDDAVEHEADDAELAVVVGIEDDDSGATVYVEDSGPGIPPEERDRVFEDGYSTSDDGTGLGLSIVERIATAHGWSVSVTEGTVGGARFEFTGVDRDVEEESVSVDTEE